MEYFLLAIRKPNQLSLSLSHIPIFDQISSPPFAIYEALSRLPPLLLPLPLPKSLPLSVCACPFASLIIIIRLHSIPLLHLLGRATVQLLIEQTEIYRGISSPHRWRPTTRTGHLGLNSGTMAPILTPPVTAGRTEEAHRQRPSTSRRSERASGRPRRRHLRGWRRSRKAPRSGSSGSKPSIRKPLRVRSTD